MISGVTVSSPNTTKNDATSSVTSVICRPWLNSATSDTLRRWRVDSSRAAVPRSSIWSACTSAGVPITNASMSSSPPKVASSSSSLGRRVTRKTAPVPMNMRTTTPRVSPSKPSATCHISVLMNSTIWMSSRSGSARASRRATAPISRADLPQAQRNTGTRPNPDATYTTPTITTLATTNPRAWAGWLPIVAVRSGGSRTNSATSGTTRPRVRRTKAGRRRAGVRPRRNAPSTTNAITRTMAFCHHSTSRSATPTTTSTTVAATR